MRRYSILFIVLGFISLSSGSSHAQRALGTKSLVLDDGNGNTLTISYPNTPPVAGNSTLNLSGGTAGGATFTPAYLQAYTTATPVIANGSAVTFASFPFSVGFTTAPTTFTVAATGVYNVDFTMQTSICNFEIMVNGVAAPNASFGGAQEGFGTIHGNAILSLNAGDVLSIVNNYGYSVTLRSTATGEVTASITAVRIQ
jgi:hypothetical protein